MNNRSVYYLMLSTLLAAPAIPANKAARAAMVPMIAEEASGLCLVGNPEGTIGTAIFTKGRASSSDGRRIEKGMRLMKGDVVTTSEDGFVAIELVDGTALNVQPASHKKLDCENSTVKERNTIAQPHLSAAVRG